MTLAVIKMQTFRAIFQFPEKREIMVEQNRFAFICSISRGH